MKSLRSSGEGTYQTLPSGLIRHVNHHNGKRVSGPARTTRKQAREAWLEKVRNTVAVAHAPLSFGNAAEAYRNRAEISPTTRQAEKMWIQAAERDGFAALAVCDIEDGVIDAYLAGCQWANATKRKRIVWIRSVLRSAGSTARGKMPPPRRSDRRPLTPAERARLTDALSGADPRIRDLVVLCWQLGLRRSEALGLRHEDFDGKVVRVRRSVLHAEGMVRESERLKSEQSRADIPAPPLIAEILRRKKTGYVVPGIEDDRPMHPNTSGKLVAEFFRSAGLEVPHGGLHTLRRTYGMTLLESGVEVVTAAELMRHDPAMLLREYSRSRNDLKVDAVARAFGSEAEDAFRDAA